MKLVQFYREEIPNNEGVWFQDIMNYTHDRLEADHAWIQWVFPLPVPSNFNVEAPLLTADEVILFNHDPALKNKYEAASMMMLDFFGMDMKFEKGWNWHVVWKEGDSAPWITEFNHNFLRMTRFLTSLRYFGEEEISKKIFYCLMTCRHLFKDTTHDFWKEAAFGELPCCSNQKEFSNTEETTL